MIIGIDLSLRSSGLVGVQGDEVLFKLVSNTELQNEELLNWNCREILSFIHYCGTQYAIDGIVIESLSFNALSADKDKLWGNYWHLKCELAKKYYKIPVGAVPVTSWRNWLLNKDEQKEAKASGKNGLKVACVEKLPVDVRDMFNQYIERGCFKKEAIFDLCDSFFLTKYRESLE